ncbi:hypothetical protein NE237_009512 [Protea cynaroides]|uniref:Uncharacterized protein n=1 Tax=Protea cynaroides TaxID=273540 RepID=A0A9Q0R0Q0_9MAGN|nr:hypothetical protein NE237_009512 [Protea cynaroides]
MKPGRTPDVSMRINVRVHLFFGNQDCLHKLSVQRRSNRLASISSPGVVFGASGAPLSLLMASLTEPLLQDFRRLQFSSPNSSEKLIFCQAGYGFVDVAGGASSSCKCICNTE